MMQNTVSEPVYRIQIVEDERIVALDLKLNLQSLGYVVSGVAASEQQALDQVEAQRPDLVLMDINLGRGGDGTQAAKLVLARFQVPVVFLTSYAEPQTLQRARDASPYGYLLKPFEMRELHATIHMALARRDHERHIEQTRRRYRLALDAANMGVFELGAGQEMVRLDGHLDALGLTDAGQASPPQALCDFLGHLDESGRAGLSRLAEAGAQSPTWNQVSRWQRDDGSSRWLEMHARRFDDEGLVVGAFRDVTAQWAAQQQLEQAAVVFDSAADAILILDEQHTVCAVNPAFTALTGWSLGDVKGLHPEEFLHAQRESDHGLMQHDPATGALHGEVVCRSRSGALFPAWEHVAPIQAGPAPPSQPARQVLSFTDISALRRAEAQIQHLAFHDALTGLGNRHHLDQCLRTLIQSEPGAGGARRFALFFIDLDGFKTINDTLGHAIGDELLVQTARRLDSAMRRTDTAIRLGGDEFVVLVQSVGRMKHLQALADKLLRSIRAPFLLSQGEPVRVSASLGMAIFPDHADSAEALIKAADTAMYAAKAAGRNRHALFDQRLTTQVVERLQIEQGLRSALQTQSLVLHWQPIVDMAHGRVLGAEALLRWSHPQFGPISPERFIPVTEETGLIEEIGAWVLQQACAQGARWQAEGWRFERIAVNVSAQQLQAPHFLTLVLNTLRDSGLPANCLELELTESALRSVDCCRKILAELKQVGVRVALDDFGTGFSSLSQLKYFALDRLKVDKAFVRDLETDGNDLAITRAIIAMAQALGLALTAEGVQTPGQRAQLLQLGLREGQGWLFSAALPAEDLQLWVRDWALDRAWQARVRDSVPD